MRGLFAHHAALRAQYPLAALIQYPKIPPRLTESIAIHLLNSGGLGNLAEGVRATLSHAGGDVLVSQPNGEHLRVEVKGTAGSAFQHLSEKDLDAHLLMWVHYDTCFMEGGTREFTVHLILTPRKHFPRAGRITLRKFLERVGHEVFLRQVDLETLQPIVSTRPSANEV